MSRETENIFKDLQKYVDENLNETGSEQGFKQDIEKLVKEYMKKQNAAPQKKVTKQNAKTADDYLDLAYAAESDREALKYAKKALELEPDNVDATALVIDLEHSSGFETVKKYEDAVARATERMKAEGYFEPKCMGAFWGMLETRPYMRLRGQYVHALLACGMYGKAREECKEMLTLNESDNLGMRFVLMHLYAYFEDDKAAKRLFKKFGSYDETEMLLPLSMLYFKKGDFETASEYLERLYKVNKDLAKFLGMLSRGESIEKYAGGISYRPFSIEQLAIEFCDNFFLFGLADEYVNWAMKQLVKFK